MSDGSNVQKRGVGCRIDKDVQITAFLIVASGNGTEDAGIEGAMRFHHPTDGRSMC